MGVLTFTGLCLLLAIVLAIAGIAFAVQRALGKLRRNGA